MAENNKLLLLYPFINADVCGIMICRTSDSYFKRWNSLVCFFPLRNGDRRLPLPAANTQRPLSGLISFDRCMLHTYLLYEGLPAVSLAQLVMPGLVSHFFTLKPRVDYGSKEVTRSY